MVLETSRRVRYVSQCVNSGNDFEWWLCLETVHGVDWTSGPCFRNEE